MDIWETLDWIGSVLTPDRALCISGVLLLSAWLLRTGLGRRALMHSRPRRHRLPAWIPLPIFLLWLGPPGLIMQTVVPRCLPGAEPWQETLAANLVMGTCSLLTCGVVCVLAQVGFVRGLKGFGMGLRHLGRDLVQAAGTLLAVWPVVLALIVAVTVLRQWFQGPDYHVPQHEELNYLVQFSQVSVRWSIVIMAVVLAPLTEELIFRGILQSVLRCLGVGAWTAVALTSLCFASIHAQVDHWPSLFALGLAMGVAYERSGSLWQAIFIHALFNGTTVLGTLLQATG